MPLIQMSDGYQLNTDKIIKFCRLRNGDVRFLDVNGGTHTGNACEVEEKFAPVISAAPGFTAICVDGDDESYTPVIGWRIHVGGTEPILSGYVGGEYEAMIAPDGFVYDTQGGRFATVDAWKSGKTSDPNGEQRPAA